MYFTKAELMANSRLKEQWKELWANRNIWNTHNKAMIEQYGNSMSPEMLASNSSNGLSRSFWKEIDDQVVQMRNQETGMEIVDDLLKIQTILPVGKTAKLYNIVDGNIAKDVKVSIDGQAPYSFDHVDYKSDGDPIPVFTAGYGVNWRHYKGLSTEGIDLILDSQEAKLPQYNKQIVDYVLNGSDKINVENYPAQGLKNHRNVSKINLGSGSGGVNVDLTTATPDKLLEFFGAKGAFGINARENRVDAYSVVWVSHDIWANLMQPYLITVGAGDNAMLSGTVYQAIKDFIQVDEIKPTYALDGNEFLGYQRRKDVLTPLVGMSTGVVALPRPLPQTNYNFQIMSAMGLQIKRDCEDRTGVVYGADLD